MTDPDSKTTILRLEINREAFDALPIREQIALQRAVQASTRTVTRKYRLYRRSGWSQGWRAFGRSLWFVSLPCYGLGVWIGQWIHWFINYHDYVVLAWRILIAVTLHREV